MSAEECVKQTLVAITNLTDDKTITEMIDFCIDNIKGIRKEQDRDTRHLAAERVNRLALDDNAIRTACSVIMDAKAL